jgi:hypothetical protein
MMQPELTIRPEGGEERETDPPDESPAEQSPSSPLTRPGPNPPSTWVRQHRKMIIVIAAVGALLLPVGWSYVGAVTKPSNQSLGVRSVEWLKDNHLRWLVNDIENFWYNHHKPKKGGAPKVPLAGPTHPTDGKPPSALGWATTAPSLMHLPAPLPIVPIVHNPLPGEGEWHPLGQPVNGIPAMYSAYVRPDPVYTSVVTGVAWMDPMLTRAALYAGVQDPGGSAWRYHAPIALADRPDVLAAFNSGFRLKDSNGGWYAEGKEVRPLRNGAATLVIHPDGTPAVGMWGRDFQMGPDVAYARQNLLLVVDGGQPVPGLDTDSLSKWGATLGNKVLVWRSGVGITANGALVYAGGNNLSASSLARVLAHAGAVRAMELDINSAWVAYFTFAPAPPGVPPGDLAVTKLSPDMRASTSKFFSAEARDFIAIFRR